MRQRRRVAPQVHDTVRRQEIHCHACGQYVQFEIDLGLNGNHVLNCPNCGHEHCRVVKDGVITEDRWASRNGPTITITSAQYSMTAYYSSSFSSSTQATAVLAHLIGAIADMTSPPQGAR